MPEAVVPANGDYAGFTCAYFERIANCGRRFPCSSTNRRAPTPNYCVTPDTLARIAAIDRMSAIKVSTGDAGYLFDLSACRARHRLFIHHGQRMCVAMWGLHCGSQAVIGQGACLNPQILKAVQERFVRDDLPAAAEAQSDANRLVAACPNAVDFLQALSQRARIYHGRRLPSRRQQPLRRTRSHAHH
jgi:dihydrodipicolinate synthase/N-acetylneuraminate lyase